MAAYVQHIGHGTDITEVANLLNNIEIPQSPFPRIKHTLIMENAAGEGSELGTSWEQLRKFYEKLNSTRVGLCIDTQHAFASGMTTWADEKEVNKIFEEVQNIAPKSISLIHLNDSEKLFGSHVDRHASIGHGFIWGSDKTIGGLKSLLKRAQEEEIDMVLETHVEVEDLVMIRKLMA